MRLIHLQTGWRMTLRELKHDRLALILLVVIPTVFYAITRLTTPATNVFFKLAVISEDTFIPVNMRAEALLFIGLAATGLLSSFLALNLIQRNEAVNRRLIICGYRTAELVAAKFMVLICIILVVAVYTCLVPVIFFQSRHLLSVYAGFCLTGFVYGSYGLLVGTIVKRELEGILLVVLLANIDIGWLQNPLFYAEAQNKFFIRFLPAFYPSQMTMISAFTDYSVTLPFIGSIIYGTVLLLSALYIFRHKMRIYKYA
jgi:hypothetical protein